MRKQYHFRHTEHGLSAWDVDHLVELTATFIAEDVAISCIKELDENYWFTENGQFPSCRVIVDHFRLMTETDLSYPVILSSSGRVMDGMHRICKAHYSGQVTIKAVKFNIDPEPDYLNVEHPDDLPY